MAKNRVGRSLRFAAGAEKAASRLPTQRQWLKGAIPTEFSEIPARALRAGLRAVN